MEAQGVRGEPGVVPLSAVNGATDGEATLAAPSFDALGFFAAFACTILHAVSDAALKGLTQYMPRADTAIAVRGVLSVLFFLCAFAREDDAKARMEGALQSPEFLTAWAVSGVLNGAIAQLYMRGLRLGELGDTLPYLSLTPAFLVVSGYLVLSEMPNFTGIIGIWLVSAGGFWLGRVGSEVPDLGDAKKPVARSLWAVLPPGAATFIIIAALCSMSSAFDKQGVRAGPPLLFGAAINSATVASVPLWRLCTWLGLLPEAPQPPQGAGKGHHLAGSSGAAKSRCAAFLLLAWWITGMVSYWCHLLASSRIYAAHVSAVRQTGALFGMLFGCLCFGERIGRKLPPVMLMVFGVCLIAVG